MHEAILPQAWRKIYWTKVSADTLISIKVTVRDYQDAMHAPKNHQRITTMRSELTFQATEQIANRYQLTRAAAAACRVFVPEG